MTEVTDVTARAAYFVEAFSYEAIPPEALKIARRCVLDTLGLYVAGTTEEVVRILIKEASDEGGAEEARLLGSNARVPVAKAARVLGSAGHAHDWDDTQVSHDPKHVYGLLTHPSVPPLSAALAIAQQVGGVDGKRFITAFLAGFEVETKVSEWMSEDHYLRGHHSSGTVGTLGACVAAAKLLGLTGEKLRHAIGIAASFAAGIRCNFGTMTKPLHVGRAAENGVIAACLAKRGLTADPNALDGRWGLPYVMSGGFTGKKLAQEFGSPLSIVSPGISIKPYPSGILTHQSMDAMLKLVTEHDVKPANIDFIHFHAGSNILNPIRYPIAINHLQAKFSMAALLSMMVLYRRAGRQEFTDEVVGSEAMQDMQRRITTKLDQNIEDAGFDRIRSRIEIFTKDGRQLVQEADERYRGGPSLPMTKDEVEKKFRACVIGLMPEQQQERLVSAVWGLEELEDVTHIVDLANVPLEGCRYLPDSRPLDAKWP